MRIRHYKPINIFTMKSILFCFLILCFYGISAQDKLLDILPLQNGLVNYSEVVQVDSISKDELYIRAKRWFVNTYKSANHVIQLDDKESGDIMGKGFFKTSWQVTFYAFSDIEVHHTVSIQVKEGRYRYEIASFRIQYDVAASQYASSHRVDSPIETWNQSRKDNSKKVFTKIQAQMEALVASIKTEMATPVKDDW